MKSKLDVFILTVFDVVLLLGTFAYLGHILRHKNHHLLIEDIIATTFITLVTGYGFYKFNETLLDDNFLWPGKRKNKFIFGFILSALLFILMIATVVIPISKRL